MLDPNEINETPKDDLEILRLIVERKDKDALHDWIKIRFGYSIPKEAICPDHDAPFDFVSDYIFGKHNFMVVLANRSGGKTLIFGILDTLMSYLMPNTEIGTVGAILYQAKKGYEYFNSFNSKRPFDHNIISRTMNSTKMRNGSSVQILTGTMSGVNSPHPQLVFLDEIDLMAWPILQQALSMPQTKNDVEARTVLTSTRKFPAGPMQRMVNEVEERGGKLYKWCIWEVVEKLPELKEELKIINDKFAGSLPKKIGNADGYYTWKDVLGKFNNLDSETWETEWLCLRPGIEGIIYGTAYSDDNNLLTEWVPKGRGNYYIFEDFGFGKDHPDVALLVFIPVEFDRVIICGERYMHQYGTDDIWKAIDEMCRVRDQRLPDKKRQIQGTIKGWVPDYHGLTEIEDRRQRGAIMVEKNEDNDLYLVHNGIKIVRKFFESGHLMITDDCPELRNEVMSYKWKMNADGTYSQIVVKKDDHGPDALRYGMIALYHLLASKLFGTMTKKLVKKPVPKEAQTLTKVPAKPITAGILTEKF